MTRQRAGLASRRGRKAWISGLAFSHPVVEFLHHTVNRLSVWRVFPRDAVEYLHQRVGRLDIARSYADGGKFRALGAPEVGVGAVDTQARLAVARLRKDI